EPRGRRLLRAARASLLALPLVVSSGCMNLNLFSPEEDIQLGVQAYDQVLEGERIITSGPEYDMVQRVTERLVAAAQVLDPQLEDVPDELSEKFPWEVRLIDAPDTVNAFCLPGGKMAVY